MPICQGASLHNFIFIVGDNTADPSYWSKAIPLNSSCVDISFRINVQSNNQTRLDYLIAAMESRNYSYYLTAACSDFPTYYSAPLFWNITRMCNYLNTLPHIKGLYFHEIRSYGTGFDWSKVSQLAKCANDSKKVIVWSEWGSWSTIKSEIERSSSVRDIFSKYGRVIVPVWANNRNTNNYYQAQDMEAQKSAVQSVSNIYCAGKRGASIQDWHWYETYGNLNVPASDIEYYIKMNYGMNGTYYQFEYYWNKGGFYDGVTSGRNYIAGTNKCYTCGDRVCNSSCGETYTICSADCTTTTTSSTTTTTSTTHPPSVVVCGANASIIVRGQNILLMQNLTLGSYQISRAWFELNHSANYTSSSNTSTSYLRILNTSGLLGNYSLRCWVNDTRNNRAYRDDQSFKVVTTSSSSTTKTTSTSTTTSTTTSTSSTSTTTSSSTTRTTTSTTTSTTLQGCLMPGNYSPCGEVTLTEAVSAIIKWADGAFSLGDVIDIINSWANPGNYPPA
jgi:hypothetical protein